MTRTWPSLLLAALAGCRPIDVEMAPSTAIPTVYTASWDGRRAAVARVEYGLDGALDLVTPDEEAAGTEHSVMLLGLKAGRTYSWQAVERRDDGREKIVGEGSFDVVPPPPDLVGVTVSGVDEALLQPGGFVITSQMGESKSYAGILDRDGDWVWWWAAEERLSIPTARAGLGGGVAFTHNDANQATDLGGTMHVAIDGSETVLTRNQYGHHDFVELPDGNVAWMSIDVREADIDGETMLVAGDRILEAPAGTSDPSAYTEVFNFFDDYPRPPWRMCEHFDAELFSTGAKDWTHCNSLMYDAERDDYLMMCKNLDALLRIDRATGAIEWQMGGEDGDFALVAGTWWSHGHMSHFWDGGLAVFDNGYHHEPQRSRGVEYTWDEETRELVQVWEHQDQGARFVPLLGDVRRLPDGNKLVSWTSAGMLTEVTPDGTVVWRAEMDLGAGIGRATWVEDIYSLR